MLIVQIKFENASPCNSQTQRNLFIRVCLLLDDDI